MLHPLGSWFWIQSFATVRNQFILSIKYPLLDIGYSNRNRQISHSHPLCFKWHPFPHLSRVHFPLYFITSSPSVILCHSLRPWGHSHQLKQRHPLKFELQFSYRFQNLTCDVGWSYNWIFKNEFPMNYLEFEFSE